MFNSSDILLYDFYTQIDGKTDITLDKSRAYKIIGESLLIKTEYENKFQYYP